MSGKIKYFIFVFISLNFLFAQGNEKIHKLFTTIGAGGSYYFLISEIEDINRFGFSGTFRIKWHPEHLLRLSLETGYTQLYNVEKESIQTEYGTTNGYAKLSTVPLVVCFSMDFFNLVDLGVGLGMYFLNSETETFGNKVIGTQISTGYSATLTYVFSISENFSTGFDLKYFYISRLENSFISLQILFSYNLFEW